MWLAPSPLVYKEYSEKVKGFIPECKQANTNGRQAPICQSDGKRQRVNPSENRRLQQAGVIDTTVAEASILYYLLKATQGTEVSTRCAA